MPQVQIIRAHGLLGVYSFTDGFVKATVTDSIREVSACSEEQVLAMCEYLENQGDEEEAAILLNRYLVLRMKLDGERNPQV